MKHIIFFAVIIIVTTIITAFTFPSSNTIHSFKIKAIDGSEIDFSKFKGKKILVVNTASKCGYTPQYEALEKVYEQYKNKLVIVGFPCNQFGGQEPGTAEEIVSFCKKNYGVTFPLTEKVDVKGDNINAIYKWLCNKSENGVLDAEIKWNFNKFLLDENGKLLAYFPSKITPDSEDILKYLK
ncbi:MAG: glutathione peroxidase [Bacteroidetes bacterium]|nr:glutathione peroxidase [Bacteroidota bacterium]MBS1648462.1 glutathione peroxidase [Bacteroidota bacterium]